MASVSLSGGSGSASGTLPKDGTPVTTSYAYSTGWSSIPIGSQITNLGASFTSSASGAGPLQTSAEATVTWPTTVFSSETSVSPSVVVSGASGVTTVFFSGNPGNVGSGWIRTFEDFYNVSYSFGHTASPTVTFNPPGSRTLFFGTAN